MQVKWAVYSPDIALYASHRDFIKAAYQFRLAEYKAAHPAPTVVDTVDL